jgi:hypothetical protein
LLLLQSIWVARLLPCAACEQLLPIAQRQRQLLLQVSLLLWVYLLLLLQLLLLPLLNWPLVRPWLLLLVGLLLLALGRLLRCPSGRGLLQFCYSNILFMDLAGVLAAVLPQLLTDLGCFCCCLLCCCCSGGRCRGSQGRGAALRCIQTRRSVLNPPARLQGAWRVHCVCATRPYFGLLEKRRTREETELRSA